MSSKALREILIGLESTPGTAVAATYSVRAMAELKAVPDKIVVDENIGSFAPARNYIGSLKAEGNIEMDGYYEDAQHLIAMALGRASRSANGGNYNYVFTLPDETAPTFATYTLQLTDGAASSPYVVKATDVFATSLEISGEAGQSWVISDELTGAEVTLPGAVTGTPSPSVATSIRMADTSLYIDTLYSDLGDTAFSGSFISFNWKLDDLQHSKLFAGNLYPTGRGNDKWTVTLELVLEVSGSGVQTEIAKILNTTQSAIRIIATSGNYSAKIDGMYFLNEVDTLDDRDGNNIIKLTYLGQKDTSNNTGNITIVAP